MNSQLFIGNISPLSIRTIYHGAEGARFSFYDAVVKYLADNCSCLLSLRPLHAYILFYNSLLKCGPSISSSISWEFAININSRNLLFTYWMRNLEVGPSPPNDCHSCSSLKTTFLEAFTQTLRSFHESRWEATVQDYSKGALLNSEPQLPVIPSEVRATWSLHLQSSLYWEMIRVLRKISKLATGYESCDAKMKGHSFISSTDKLEHLLSPSHIPELRIS